MKIRTVHLCAVLAAFTPVICLADLSLHSLVAKPEAGPKQDLGAEQGKIVSEYVIANKSVLLANSIMADALGLKDVAAQAKATADGLNDGATKDNLKDSDKASSDSAKAIHDAMAKQGGTMDAESKKRFATAFVPLTLGMVKYAELLKHVSSFATSLKGASLVQVPKLQTGLYIVQNVPVGLSNLTNTMNGATAFAKSNDIPVPKDSTEALAALDK